MISGNDRPHRLRSTAAITCSSDLLVRTIRWLDGNQQELLTNAGQQQLVLTIEEVREELNNTMYRCEVSVMLTTEVTNIAETITFRVIGKHTS